MYLEHCPRGEAVITGNTAPFLYEVASHVKKTAIPAINIIILVGLIDDCSPTSQ